MYYHYTMDPYENDNTTLFLRFFKEDRLAQGRVKLHKLNLTFRSLSILTRPDNVAGLRRFEPEEAVL